MFSKLFHSDILRKVNLIISDGNQEEMSQIDASILTVFPNARRQRCGFHLVRMGWNSHVLSKKIFKGNEFLYDKVCHHLKAWIYSWRTARVETEVEYKVSKLMFYKFLNTRQIRNTLGVAFIESVEDFVKKHIEPHETNFVFYLRKHLRHFDEYINCLHEGTNNALRHSAAPIGPTMCIENTMRVMNNNSERARIKKQIENSIQFVGTKLYSKLNCSKHLNKFGYEILLSSWTRKDQYVSIRVEEEKWLVIHKNNDEGGDDLKKTNTDHSKEYCPKFKRVRKVILCEKKLICSCSYRKRYGIGCAHEYNVVSRFRDYIEPSHHECSIRWWNIYSMCGMSGNAHKTEIESNLLKSFHVMQDRDLIGLPVKSHSHECIKLYTAPIPKKFIYPKFPRCSNYPNLRVYPKELDMNIHSIAELTQVLSQYSENDENSLHDLDIEYDIGDILDSDSDDIQDFRSTRKKCYASLKPFESSLTSIMDSQITSFDEWALLEMIYRSIFHYFNSKPKKTWIPRSHLIKRNVKMPKWFHLPFLIPKDYNLMVPDIKEIKS